MTTTSCKGCERPLEDRRTYPHCRGCRDALHELLARTTSSSGDEIGNPRCTDAGNAIRFATMFFHDVLYSPEAGRWWVWDGRVWVKDAGDILVSRMAKVVVKRMFLVAAKEDDQKVRDGMLQWAKRSESVAGIAAMLVSARSVCRITRYQDFDADPWLFNAANAAINLRTGAARPHSRRDLCTKLSPVRYDPAAKCPRWELFLREIMPGHEACCIPFLQRSMGYTMTGRTDEECFFVASGGGRNGKTKLLETFQHLMGEYGATASFDAFVVKAGGGDKLNDIAGFKGARMVAASESEHSKRLAESKIKQMTGGDTVVGEFKYEEQFSYVPTYKIWLRTNYKPRVVGTDDGIWDRVRLIQFNEYFGDDRRDTQLGDKLKAEASGILNWAVAGAVAWAKDGLGISQCVKDTTEDYRKDQDVLGSFMADRCLVEQGAWVEQGALYKEYKLWAEQAGEFVMSKTEFNERLELRFDRSKSGQRGRHWRGIALRSEHAMLEEDAKTGALQQAAGLVQ